MITMKLMVLCNVLLIAYVGAVEHSYSSSPRADEDTVNDLNLLQTQIAIQTLQEDDAMAPANVEVQEKTADKDLMHHLEVLQTAKKASEHKADAKFGKEVPSFASMYPDHFGFWGRRAAILTETVESQEPVIDPPCDNEEPYNLESSDRRSFSQFRQDRALRPILLQINHGFFVESGAGDGETDSNTLMYERSYNWTGLLVEPDPYYFSAMKSKNRRAYLYNGALSPSVGTQTIAFDSQSGAIISVQAQPLHLLLQAIGRNVVDFWSLDMQGNEGTVLENTDFSKFEVGILLVRTAVSDIQRVNNAVTRNGFWQVGTLGDQDTVFANPSYFETRNLNVPDNSMLDP